MDVHDAHGIVVEAEAKVSQIPAASLPFGADYCSLSWTDGNVTEMEYKKGGPAGSTVAILTFGYTDGNVTSITKS